MKGSVDALVKTFFSASYYDMNITDGVLSDYDSSTGKRTWSGTITLTSHSQMDENNQYLTKSVKITNGTWTKTGTSIKLSTGVYIIIGWIYFKSADKGRRGIRFINQNDNFIVDSQNVIMTNGSEIMLNTMSLFTATYDISIYLQGFQSSGSSLGVARSILKAVRIA